ncbi:MAG TPA: pilus assembly protein TadB, partial [Trinickia sp.]|nr:pilus assembly protein TadB [Trinickia sp.]
MNPLFYAFIVLVFVAVVLAVEAIYIWWNSHHGGAARRIEARIRALSAGGQVQKERLSILKDRMLRESGSLEKLLMQMPRVKKFDLLIQQSGLDLSVARLLLMSVTLPLVVLATATFLPVSMAISALVALATGTVPFLYVARQRTKRLRRLEQQLPDVADAIGRALRA